MHEFSDRLINVSISWQLPETTYGTIDEYDVVISETPLDVSNATIPLDSFMKKVQSDNVVCLCTIVAIFTLLLRVIQMLQVL